MSLSDQLYKAVGSTWKISLQRLFVLLHEVGQANNLIDSDKLYEAMQADYQRSSEKTSFDSIINKKDKVTRIGVANKRQKKMMH